jgi:hypothetical protein
MAARDEARLKTIGDDVQVLTSAHSLMEKVGLGADPTDFGLPDLLEDGIDREEQDARLLDVVENHLAHLPLQF